MFKPLSFESDSDLESIIGGEEDRFIAPIPDGANNIPEVLKGDNPRRSSSMASLLGRSCAGDSGSFLFLWSPTLPPRMDDIVGMPTLPLAMRLDCSNWTRLYLLHWSALASPWMRFMMVGFPYPKKSGPEPVLVATLPLRSKERQRENGSGVFAKRHNYN